MENIEKEEKLIVKLEIDNYSNDCPQNRKSFNGTTRFCRMFQSVRHGKINLIKIFLLVVVVVVVHVYLIFALSVNFQKASKLLFIAGPLWLLFVHKCFLKSYLATLKLLWWKKFWMCFNEHRRSIKMCFSGMIILSFIILLVYECWSKDEYHRFIPLCGLIVFVLASLLFSNNRTKVSWIRVLSCISLQLLLGLILLKWTYGTEFLHWLSSQIVRLLSYAHKGSSFLYGYLAEPNNAHNLQPVFYFSVLQVLIYFGALVSVLNYYGIIQWVIIRISWMIETVLGTSPLETFYAVICIFFGQSEAILLIQPYLSQLTDSEMFAVMTVGFSCISAALLPVYVSFGACPADLLTASLLSAPASLAISKIMYPEDNDATENTIIKLKFRDKDDRHVFSAIINGALQSMRVVFAIAAIIIATVGLLDLVNAVATWLGELIRLENVTFETVLSYCLFPVALVMGPSDSFQWDNYRNQTLLVAELIGVKTSVNEFVAYQKMSQFIQEDRISPRAKMISTYSLCGFSNLISMAVQVATVCSLCPEKRSILSKIAVKSLIAGTISSLMTACVAGTIISNSTSCDAIYQASFSGNATVT